MCERSITNVITNSGGTYTIYSDGSHNYLGWVTEETFWKIQANPNYFEDLKKKYDKKE